MIFKTSKTLEEYGIGKAYKENKTNHGLATDYGIAKWNQPIKIRIRFLFKSNSLVGKEEDQNYGGL